MDVRKTDRTLWGRYIELCRSRDVAPRALRWYVIHVERFLRAVDRSPAECTAENMLRYLQEIGREKRMPGWMFAQQVQALQKFFADLLGNDWARQIDWACWVASARELERDHSTVARHNQPLTSADRCPIDHNSSPDQLLARMAAEVRMKNYSIRTEEAYVGWVKRYLNYVRRSDARQPRGLLHEPHGAEP